LEHYKETSSATAYVTLAPNSEAAQEGKAGQKSKVASKWVPILERFSHKFEAWGYALTISLFPFIIVFIFFTGPRKNFAFLEFFHDNALLYVGVSMSALALYSYKMAKLIKAIHIIVSSVGMMVYFLSINESAIPLFDILDRKMFIAVFLLVSIVLGLFALIYSSYTSVKRGEQ
jgi:hypothetical protein